MRNKNGANAIADYSGNAKEAVAGEKSGQYKQSFTISGVKAGTYKLAIFKGVRVKGSAKDAYVVTVVDVTVADKPVDIKNSIDMWLYGDVNFDGIINAMDVTQLLKKSGKRKDSVIDDNNIHQMLAADSNDDGIINAIDVTQILKKSARRDSTYDRFVD